MTHAEECHVCGGAAHIVSDPVEMHIGSRSTKVAAARMRCAKCGEEFFLPGQMELAQKAASSQLRSELGLLGPEDIRLLRLQYDLTQVDLERLLGVGAKTVVRWERGTVFQNQATDALLRVIRDVPEAAMYLAQSRGIAIRRQDVAAEVLPVSILPSSFVAFNWSYEPAIAPPDDPNIVSLDSYRARRNLGPIPPDFVRSARL